MVQSGHRNRHGKRYAALIAPQGSARELPAGRVGRVIIRRLERFAVGSLLLSFGLIAADRIRHPRGFFFFVPVPRHTAGLWKATWFVFRTRPGLASGVVLLIAGLCVALVAACAGIGSVLRPRESDHWETSD